MKRIFLAVLALLSAIVAAAQTNIQVRVHNVVAQDEEFRVTFVIEGENSASDFSWECPADFDLLIGPQQSSSSSISIINGKRTSSRTISYTYILSPRNTGDFVLPAATAKVKGNAISSAPVSIKVVPAEDRNSQNPVHGNSGQNGIPSDPGANGSSQGGGRQEQNGQAQSAEYGDIVLDLSLDRTDVVVGQPINATLKIYQRANLSGFENADFPSFKGFWSQEVEAPTNIEFNREVHDGKIYDAALLRRYVLIPQQTGKLVIDPAELVCLVSVRVQSRTGSIFDGFFDDYQTVRKKVRSKSVTVNVSPLPSGAPASFGGGVGKFSISAKLARTRLKAHEANSLIVTLSGRGNVALVEAPKVEFPIDMEVYDTKATDKTPKSSLSGSKEFEFPFIPRSPGEFTIEPVQYSYYDIDAGKYVTISTQPISFTVEKGADMPETVVSGGVLQKDVRNLGEDIRFINTKAGNFSSKGDFLVSSPLFVLACLLVLLLAAVVWYIVRSVESKLSDTVGRKTRKATKKALRQLKNASVYLDRNLPAAFYEELHKSLVGFVADKFNMPMTELNKENICARLLERGVPQETADEYAALLDECEFARYAPSSDSGQMHDHYDKAAGLISTIDSCMKTSVKTKGGATALAVICLLSLSINSFAAGQAENSATVPAEASEPLSSVASAPADVDEYAETLWERANRAYAEGRWEDAAGDYALIVSLGLESAPLYYNLGNACYKSGSVSGAILNYKRALKIDSSYPDARYNLDFVRSLTQDRIEKVPEFILTTWAKKVCYSLSSDTWAMVFIAGLVLLCVCLLLFFLAHSAAGKRTGFILAIILLLADATFLSFSLTQKSAYFVRDEAVVTVPVTSVKAAPSSERTNSLFVLHEGAELRLLDTVGDWCNIEIADGRQGWLESSAIEVI